MTEHYKAGDKIKFTEEKRRYTIVACDNRYLICTKPFNAKKTYLYTIVDLEEEIRGTDGYLFTKYNYTRKEEAQQYLDELNCGKCEISHRHRLELNIEDK